MFVVMLTVQGVAVPVMDIINMVAVLNGLMTAALPVSMLSNSVVSMRIGGAHHSSFQSCSRACAMASRTTCSMW